MRIIIASNRLPVIFTKNGSGLHISNTIGGLTSGINDFLNSDKVTNIIDDYLWIGWNENMAIDSEEEREMIYTETKKRRLYPISIDNRQVDMYYDGFCNRTISPLFLGFPTHTTYREDYWKEYQLVNKMFCDKIVNLVRENDIIWVNDYHLMLLPKYLRDKQPELTIGFFLHIPFPNMEVFRLMPAEWRREILDGILGANTIGFHTQEYVDYFIRAVQENLGQHQIENHLIVSNHLPEVKAFPMGIDFDKYNNAASKSEVLRYKSHFDKEFSEKKIILSVNRLDYTKGIPFSLMGYEKFLEANQDWHNRVELVLIVAPSRLTIDYNRETKRQIDELVGRINGRFSSVSWTPIRYQFKSVTFQYLAAIYRTSDVSLVTPLKDGMNLMAKEYIASRSDRLGVLILSETAGASEELKDGILINPYNVEQIADALYVALTMPQEEQIRRNQIMRDVLMKNDIFRWGNSFVKSLLACSDSVRTIDTAG